MRVKYSIIHEITALEVLRLPCASGADCSMAAMPPVDGLAAVQLGYSRNTRAYISDSAGSTDLAAASSR
jgi:hypothetical protein